MDNGFWQGTPLGRDSRVQLYEDVLVITDVLGVEFGILMTSVEGNAPAPGTSNG